MIIKINDYYSYDYEIGNVVCKNPIANCTNDKYNFNDCIFYSMYQAWYVYKMIWIDKDKKYKIIKLYNLNHVFGDINSLMLDFYPHCIICIYPNVPWREMTNKMTIRFTNIIIIIILLLYGS